MRTAAMQDGGSGRQRMRAAAALMTLVAFGLAPTREAQGLINLNYTPVELVRQSDLILRLELGPVDGAGALSAKVVQVFQGKTPDRLRLSVSKADRHVIGKLQEAFAGREKAAALLFIGDFSSASNKEPAIMHAKPIGVLHVGLVWFGLYKQPGDMLRVGSDELDLLAVWAGSTAMLERGVEYIKADMRADVPTTAGVEWGADARVAALERPANRCMAVDLEGDGKLCLFVLADSGDRLFQPSGNGRTMKDITTKLNLDTKSKHAAWGDFGADGRLDLASWDGTALTVRIRAEDGTLKSSGVTVPVLVRRTPYGAVGDCIGLATLDVGTGRPAEGDAAGSRRAGLLVSTSAEPVLLVPADGGKFVKRALAATGDEFAGQNLGQAGPCAVADFDGDAVVDVVQPFAKGVLFYKGKGPGLFAAPTGACDMNLGGNLTAAFSGDYDADGLLDVWVTGGRGCFLFANAGGGKFHEVYYETGEVTYISKPDIVGGSTCDINNDGRQDLLLLYPGRGPQLFFNRGFRCFGYAKSLEPADSDMGTAEAVMEGQRAGAVADFNADGAQDLAVATANGDVCVLFREAADGPNLSLTVALPPGTAGPVNVIGYDAERCLGAQAVSAGSPAFFSRPEKGPITLKWRMPGAKEQQKRVIVLKPTRFVLPRGTRAAPVAGDAARH